MGDCAWCGGPLSSDKAVTLWGPWREVWQRVPAELQGKFPIWCSTPCLTASGSPALCDYVYPETRP